MKRILITAGGTAERIDQVRSITNHSTGQLGCLIAERFLANGIAVDYLTTQTAMQPTAQAGLRIDWIHDTKELAACLTTRLEEQAYDAVIHSMAVSDFTPASSFSIEEFTKKINERLAENPTAIHTEDLVKLIEDSAQTAASKISSNTDYLFLALKKTPKVIQSIKKIQPKTQLVSFKLLVDVPKEALFEVAKDSMAKNAGDFVLANDLTSIHSGQHTGYLIDKTGRLLGEAPTKAAIADLIFTTLTQGKDE